MPVLIAWVTPAEAPDFASDVAGRAGSVALTGQNGRVAFVTGQIELDWAKFAAMLRRPVGAASARLIVMRELGHLVGLAHVNDPVELMYATSGGALDYARATAPAWPSWAEAGALPRCSPAPRHCSVPRNTMIIVRARGCVDRYLMLIGRPAEG